ncbi:hypothetical protein C2845_PM01G33470 [Panicum miliaceum]|uniref:cysteine dioxygenase n=1 Tax=Panicum miliaceum TaxID=4540 RepID=A0A3L6TR30_PANMI|nr:hypothetical protein C2845_PM01G33470 [Panicum miliaceum]
MESSAAGVRRSEESREGRLSGGAPRSGEGAHCRCSRARVAERGGAGRSRDEEVEGGGAGERRRGVAARPGRAATAPLSGQKRKREAEDGGSGRQSGGENWSQLAERRRHPAMAPPPVPRMVVLQLPPLLQLVTACRAVFNGSSLPPMAPVVHFIRSIMNLIGPYDVGLRDDVDFFHRMNAAGRQNPPIITCKTILQCQKFAIAVFFLPLGAVMPLHDHLGMTVFSKLLIGSAHVEGYDWVRPRISGRGSRMLAEKVLDRDVTPASGTWALFPESGGNMHRFVAGEERHCAFLDVLAPPYAPAEQRRCTYYRDIPYEPCRCAVRSGRLTETQMHGRPLAWLEEVDEPRDLRIARLPYRDPRIFRAYQHPVRQTAGLD